MKILERRVQEIGQSLLVSLPKGWTRQVGVKKGTSVRFILGERGELSIQPEFIVVEKKSVVVLPFDKNFKRRFIREYFNNNETITIKQTSNFSASDKQTIHNFLKFFMNAQIIEETSTKLVVRLFTINDLTIEECINRMHFISLNFIDSLFEKESGSLNDLRDTKTRFYYMAIMQIRRFLSEGQYVGKNKISLLRAMDLRMVAERIQHIGEILVSMEKIQDKNVQDLFLEVKEFYKKSFSYCINDEYEKALLLYNESKKVLKKIQKTSADTKNKKAQDAYNKLEEILRFAKEISMFVR